MAKESKTRTKSVNYTSMIANYNNSKSHPLGNLFSQCLSKASFMYPVKGDLLLQSLPLMQCFIISILWSNVNSTIRKQNVIWQSKSKLLLSFKKIPQLLLTIGLILEIMGHRDKDTIIRMGLSLNTPMCPRHHKARY